MIHVQYYDESPTHGTLIPVCGDRGTVILDGRNSEAQWHADAKRFNGFRRPIYKAYQLFSGRNVIDCKPISGVIPLN